MTFVLMYHDVVESAARDSVGFPGAAPARYKMDPARFEAHLDAIQRAGVSIGLVTASTPPARAAITFDDGGANSLRTADVVEQRGWRGHFFITTALIDRPGFLSADEIKELAKRGHLVGSHSDTHPARITELSESTLHMEWERSAATLSGLLGERPLTASAPGGHYSDRVLRAAAAAGYR
jgi:peptidoglycan/xylan/chitin deacetylase (PgdA/CDA1 family)